MAEVSRVPLQPIASGSLVKLWLGVILALLAGAGLAWAAVPKGVSVDVIREGTGPHPGPEDVIFVNYVGTLGDGKEFDRSQDLPLPVEGIFPKGNPLPLDAMVPGFRQGAVQMKKGGKYKIHIPAKLGYGANPPEGAPIPPNSDLNFEVELIDFMSREDFQRRVAMFQQMMQSQGQGQGQGAGAAQAPPAR